MVPRQCGFICGSCLQCVMHGQSPASLALLPHLDLVPAKVQLSQRVPRLEHLAKRSGSLVSQGVVCQVENAQLQIACLQGP